MKIRINTDVSAAGMTGFGANTLVHDNEKVSMHPPLPENIEHVMHDMRLKEHKEAHRVVSRRHSEYETGSVKQTGVGDCCFSNRSKFTHCRCKPSAKM